MSSLTLAATRLSWRDRLAERPFIALLGVFALLYLGTGLRDHGLFTENGIRAVLLLACPLAIFGAAETLCMLTGGISLSVTMTANLAAYVAASKSHLGTAPALALALGVGVAVGLVNGVGIGVFKVNPLIMTLGMSSVLLGITTVGLVGNGFLAGTTQILPVVSRVSAGTLIGPIPSNAVLLAVIAALFIWGLGRTGLGRLVYAVGDNAVASRLAGVRLWQVLVAVYVGTELLAAVAGLLYSGISGGVAPDQTNGYLLTAIAAAVLGGTSIFGGQGGYAGTIVGALSLTVLDRLLTSLDTSDAVRQVVYGLIVLALAWLYARVTGRRLRT